MKYEHRVVARLTGGTLQDNDHGSYCFIVGADFGGSGICNIMPSYRVEHAGYLMDGIMRLLNVADSSQIKGKPVWVVWEDGFIDGGTPHCASEIIRLEPLIEGEGKPLIMDKDQQCKP